MGVDELKKMMIALANGQSAMKAELLESDRKLQVKIDNLDKKIDKVEMRLTKRIDRLGKQLATLEEDCVTREEFEELRGN